MPSYKPQGYSSVSPYLIVDGASRTIETGGPHRWAVGLTWKTVGPAAR